MNHHNITIKYIQEGNCFNDEVNIEVSTIEGQSDIILLIVPGIDGSSMVIKISIKPLLKILTPDLVQL